MLSLCMHCTSFLTLPFLLPSLPPFPPQGLLRILASLSNLSSRLFNVNFPEKLLEHLQVSPPSLPSSLPPSLPPLLG